MHIDFVLFYLLLRKWNKNYSHYMYMFCSWLAWQNTHGLLLSYHCGASVTFLSWVFAINMATPNLIYTKEGQKAVIHFCGLVASPRANCAGYQFPDFLLCYKMDRAMCRPPRVFVKTSMHHSFILGRRQQPHILILHPTDEWDKRV
jgi:hypothetical protein